MQQTKITIIGTGGVGGFFGARLAQNSRCLVNFVARGKNLTALREHGLQVQSSLGDIHLPQVRVSDDPAALGAADFVLICVKQWDTEAADRSIIPILQPETAVISLQNGVQKDVVIRAIVGEREVVGGVCFVSAQILCPGVIGHTGTMQKLVFGEYSGSISPRALNFGEICRRSGIDFEIAADIRRTIWEKFAFLVGFSAATTTTRSPIGEIRANPKTRALLFDLMRETAAVGRAHGIPLDENFAENRLAFCDGLPFEMTSSMHHDLEQGKRLELPWLSGSVVALGAATGIPVPLNRAVSDILELHALGKMDKKQCL